MEGSLSRTTHDHDASPEKCDEREEAAWSDLAKNDCRRRLEEDVWNEEDESYDGVAIHAWSRAALRIHEAEVDRHPKILSASGLVGAFSDVQTRRC